ncbi:MAG: hypothetical protein R2794_14010 [Chitinophagales bacterium]
MKRKVEVHAYTGDTLYFNWVLSVLEKDILQTQLQLVNVTQSGNPYSGTLKNTIAYNYIYNCRRVTVLSCSSIYYRGAAPKMLTAFAGTPCIIGIIEKFDAMEQSILQISKTKAVEFAQSFEKKNVALKSWQYYYSMPTQLNPKHDQFEHAILFF